VSTWAEVFLGVIAAATLLAALAQVGVFVAAGLVARRVARLVDSVDRDLKPLFGHLDSIGRDASRAASLATAQVERADALFSDVAVRIEETLATVQSSIVRPAREGRALMTAFRAAFEAIRETRRTRPGRQGRSEDEDALFI
jgi:hypothetical protein